MTSAPLGTPNYTLARSLADDFVARMLDEADAMERHGHKALAADLRAVANATKNCANQRLKDRT